MTTYRYVRQEIDSAIELLIESYPKAFFEDSEKRRPLKQNITADLAKDGVALSRELLQQAVSFYESHFGYQLALEAGAKRLDLQGKEVGTVTETEASAARKYVHDRRQEQRERRQEEQKQRNGSVVVEKISSLKIAKPPNVNLVKEEPMPSKTAPKTSNGVFEPLQALLNATHDVYQAQPEPLRKPFVIAGLRALIGETEKIIAVIEEQQ